MITLHNAVVPFDGDEIVISDPKTIKVYTIDHSLINSDATRIEMDSGTTYLVQEDIDTIKDLISKDLP